SIIDIPFGAEQFDVICAFDIIEHVNPKDTEKAINELYRVLKPGGFVILTTPSGFFGDWVYDLTHINVRPPKFWKIMFSNSGFRVVMPYVPSFLKYFLCKKIPLPDQMAFKLEVPIRFLLGHYYVRKGRLYMIARK
ncbi:MAG: class I SAM-dependent methyltransferase, partial [Nitrososphaerales archaeon]